MLQEYNTQPNHKEIKTSWTLDDYCRPTSSLWTSCLIELSMIRSFRNRSTFLHFVLSSMRSFRLRNARNARETKILKLSSTREGSMMATIELVCNERIEEFVEILDDRLVNVCRLTAMEIRAIRFIYGRQLCTDSDALRCAVWFATFVFRTMLYVFDNVTRKLNSHCCEIRTREISFVDRNRNLRTIYESSLIERYSSVELD